MGRRDCHILVENSVYLEELVGFNSRQGGVARHIDFDDYSIAAPVLIPELRHQIISAFKLTNSSISIQHSRGAGDAVGSEVPAVCAGELAFLAVSGTVPEEPGWTVGSP